LVHAAPELAWYLPTGQFAHAVRSRFVNCPAAQAWHEAALYVVVIWPCGHSVHSCPVLLCS
jgi:hypothetical protein